MRKFALFVAGIFMLATSVVAAPEVASAARITVYDNGVVLSAGNGHRHNHRRYWRHHHRHHSYRPVYRSRVCRVERVKRVVIRNHHRYVTRYKVRRCYRV